MNYDPANDGPEVRVIQFFRKYPEGASSRQMEEQIKELRRKNAKTSGVSSKRLVSVAYKRKADTRRVASQPGFSS